MNCPSSLLERQIIYPSAIISINKSIHLFAGCPVFFQHFPSFSLELLKRGYKQEDFCISSISKVNNFGKFTGGLQWIILIYLLGQELSAVFVLCLKGKSSIPFQTIWRNILLSVAVPTYKFYVLHLNSPCAMIKPSSIILTLNPTWIYLWKGCIWLTH